MKNVPRIVLIFDGSCNFCTACVELLRVLDWRHKLQCLPFQLPDVPQTYGLTVEQCEQAAWAITNDGHTYRGAQAISVALDATMLLPFFLFLFRFPRIMQIENKIYAWVAKNRRFFPGIRPYCTRPDKPCGE